MPNTTIAYLGPRVTTCPHCWGAGRLSVSATTLDTANCQYCHGSGYVTIQPAIVRSLD